MAATPRRKITTGRDWAEGFRTGKSGGGTPQVNPGVSDLWESKIKELISGEPVVVAVACSDIHLSSKVPLCRTAEPNWWEAQARPLREVTKLINYFKVPLLIAGDLFDDGWRPSRCPPELINFAIRELPYGCFAVPGQHDLPHHRLEDLQRSAFWTLVEAGKLTYIQPGSPIITPELLLYGFPFEVPVTPCPPTHELESKTRIAVVHKYVWRKGHSHPGAREEDRVNFFANEVKGYQTAIVGDNHLGFYFRRKGEDETTIFNCGTLLRRKRDEIPLRPMVGLIHAGGGVSICFLDREKDVFSEGKDNGGERKPLDSHDFLEELSHLGEAGLSFEEALLKVLKGKEVSKGVRKLILKVLEEKK